MSDGIAELALVWGGYLLHGTVLDVIYVGNSTILQGSQMALLPAVTK